MLRIQRFVCMQRGDHEEQPEQLLDAGCRPGMECDVQVQCTPRRPNAPLAALDPPEEPVEWSEVEIEVGEAASVEAAALNNNAQ